MAQNHFISPVGKKRERVTITVRNAYLLWPNFEGREGKYNAKGDRNFSIMMREADGLELIRQGWTSVSPVKKREDDEDPEIYYKLPVAVKFENYPPRIWMLSDNERSLASEREALAAQERQQELGTGSGKELVLPTKDVSLMDRVMLDEDTVEFLDRLEFEKIDMVISGSNWNVGANSGRKAYLQSAFFTLYVDELEREYGVVNGIEGVGQKNADTSARKDYDYEGEEAPFELEH
jgi:hypothetical protein